MPIHQGTEKSEEVQSVQALHAVAAQPHAQEAVDPVFPWAQSDPAGGNAPAQVPVWTRYIDSRLKQFCTR
jgi:hypothetical protein